ncbi:unnamed protein product [Somion occarium]|uniref:SWIM-type domain-containing protein n=1 Tax=Somion occarium TaxID=3059160 RepID=A0ABP1D5H6_9APHY
MILSTADVVIDSIDSADEDDVDEYIEKLRFLFSENLLLAALDLIDRDSVIKFVTPWKHSTYHVLGSTTTYTVFPGNSSVSDKLPAYCTCPAFAYSVLLSGSELMCKHLLATKIAIQLSRCIERPVTRDDLADIAVRRLRGDLPARSLAIK